MVAARLEANSAHLPARHLAVVARVGVTVLRWILVECPPAAAPTGGVLARRPKGRRQGEVLLLIVHPSFRVLAMTLAIDRGLVAGSSISWPGSLR